MSESECWEKVLKFTIMLSNVITELTAGAVMPPLLPHTLTSADLMSTMS